MAYCTKCGMKNEDDAEFCKKCGASLIGNEKNMKKMMTVYVQVASKIH